jgi:site-specific recombinase XerD
MPVNPASLVRGPSHLAKRGKTPVLSPEEARRVLDAIDVSTHAGLRDRALIALMVFSFARIDAALAMKVEDVFVRLENAAAMANHASTRTTQLYDRRRDEVNLDEGERIAI